MTINERFLARYRENAVSILKSAISTIEKGYDQIGSAGSIVLALSDVHAGMMLVDDEKNNKERNMHK